MSYDYEVPGTSLRMHLGKHGLGALYAGLKALGIIEVGDEIHRTLDENFSQLSPEVTQVILNRYQEVSSAAKSAALAAVTEFDLDYVEEQLETFMTLVSAAAQGPGLKIY